MSEQEPAVPGWRKSSRCDANNCVEVARHDGAVRVRNNTRPDVQLGFDGDSWRHLLRDLRSGAHSR